MVQLLLSEPSWNDDEDFIALKERISCLKRLEPIICSLITSEGRSEARLWFCKTVACLSSISPQAQRDSFLELLRSKPRNLVLCAQILRMIFEKRPHKVGPIIAKKPYILEKFFKGKSPL
ncbi:hypothetical protein GIB67_032883 [Kingdonia uniflora]|uniref:Uncharacterized protein n=1 Tax=Kingdonia uniflora TaxID=39325 RepID=A0A7J7NBX2_9MAGN|nr:hypothetical protein GIB67_032883 [Kingdonia uniflora]